MESSTSITVIRRSPRGQNGSLPSSQRESAPARGWLAFCAAVLLLMALVRRDATDGGDAAAGGGRRPDCHLRLERDRRDHAWRATRPSRPAETILYTGFVQAAVYNAVVGVEGRYAPYRFHAHAPRGTSAQAAAVAAAHQVLVTYVPSAQANLDAAYATSLAQIPDGRRRPRASRSAPAPPTT